MLYVKHIIYSFFLSEETVKYAKTGCREKCGNVTIPFPFGIGASCSINQWYIVDCKNSTPYLPALNNLKVLGVDLKNHTVTVSTPRITDCQNPLRNSSNIMGVKLGGSPFLFSKTHNKFVFEGCGIASMMDNGNILTACTTSCHSVTLNDRNNCFGIGCCQTPIPHYHESYIISLTSLDEESGGCGSAFLVDETSYVERKFSVRNTSFIPVSLMWILTDSDQVTCCYDRTPIMRKVDMLNGTIVYTWNCSNEYARGTGNPYLADGCTYRYGT
ncbi:putative wall-associated receptor kinase [Helianthus annuus]|nr:putative wall-associated receptor kinase [Helianthus annuus]